MGLLEIKGEIFTQVNSNDPKHLLVFFISSLFTELSYVSSESPQPNHINGYQQDYRTKIYRSPKKFSTSIAPRERKRAAQTWIGQSKVQGLQFVCGAWEGMERREKTKLLM